MADRRPWPARNARSPLGALLRSVENGRARARFDGSVGAHRAGVFICIESAYPSIARKLTSAGADVLINISNDGYLGPTAVTRQHLANAVFRAVENGRPLLSVTNT